MQTGRKGWGHAGRKGTRGRGPAYTRVKSSQGPKGVGETNILVRHKHACMQNGACLDGAMGVAREGAARGGTAYARVELWQVPRGVGEMNILVKYMLACGLS